MGSHDSQMNTTSDAITINERPDLALANKDKSNIAELIWKASVFDFQQNEAKQDPKTNAAKQIYDYLQKNSKSVKVKGIWTVVIVNADGGSFYRTGASYYSHYVKLKDGKYAVGFHNS